MPVTDFSSINKRVSDGLKTWLPRLTDSSYIAGTPVGKLNNILQVATQPGIGLAAYGLSKLNETKYGRQGIKELEGIPNFPVTPEINLGSKLAKQVGQHADELAPLAMAVPKSLTDYIWSTIKVTKRNKYGETKVVDDMVYNTLKPALEKYAEGVAKLSSSKISTESVAEDALGKVVSAINDPKYDIPKDLHGDDAASLQHILKEKGHREIDRLITESKQTVSEASSVYKDKEGKSVNPVANAASDLRSPEQAVLEAEKPVDKVKEEKIKLAGGVFDKLHSPKIRAMYEGLANRRTATEIRKELAADGIDLSRGGIRNYIDNKGAGAASIMKPIVKAEQVGPEKLTTPELQKLIISQRKLLQPAKHEPKFADKTIDQLRRHGSSDDGTLSLVRRFLIGAQPSQLWHGKSEDLEKRDTLLRINTELEKLFKIKDK